MSKNVIIAIDGPAGSGKSTIAKYVADKLGYILLDTGALYRAITNACIENGSIGNDEKITETARSLDIKLDYRNHVTHVYVNDVEVTTKIRTPEVNSHVSEVARIPEVREHLLDLQRGFGKQHNIVVEGRDTTTVVFPNADVKIFMVASVEERAKRRLKELSDKGVEITLDEVKDNLLERDRIDSTRSVAPLRKADDAVEIDTTSISIEDEFNKIVERLEKIKV